MTVLRLIHVKYQILFFIEKMEPGEFLMSERKTFFYKSTHIKNKLENSGLKCLKYIKAYTN